MDDFAPAHQEGGTAKTDPMVILAHQMRTPLGGIRFASQMLLDGDCGTLPETAKETVARIQRSATHLLGLVEDMLRPASSGLALFEAKPVHLDVAAEIRSVLEDVRPFAKAKGLVLRSHIEEMPSDAFLDPDMLRHSISNIVENAIAYTDTGTVDVSVSKIGDRIRILVRDTGQGLRAEEILHMFQPGYRGSAARGPHVGAGLGLYIAKGLLEAMDGSVAAQSNGEGCGSSMTVDLPWHMKTVDEGPTPPVR